MSRKLQVEIVGDSASLERAFGRGSASAEGFGAKLKSVGKIAAEAFIGVGVAAGVVGYESVKAAAKFQSSMELIHTQAGATQKEVEKLSGSVLDLAHAVGTGPDVLAEGLYHLESQGLRGAKAMDALKIAAEGAKVGGANLEDVTNALGATMVSSIKGSKDLSGAMGDLNATVGAGDMRMQDLAEAMGTGLPAKAALAKVSLQDISAALAVFGDNNIRGGAAGTLLASSLRILEAPSKAASKELAKVGLSGSMITKVVQGSGGLAAGLQLVKDHLASISSSDLPTFINRAFGGRQSGGVQILITQFERFKTKLEEIKKASGTFGDAWQATTRNTSFQFDELKAGLDAIAIRIGDKLLPAVNTVVTWINQNWPQISSVVGRVLSDVGVALNGLKTAIGATVSYVQAHWAQITAVFDVVRDAVVAAAQWMSDEVQAHWTQISRAAESAFNDVKAIITTTVSVIKALWSEFGSSLETIARNTWNTIKTVIGAEIEVIKGIINVFAGILRGDWGRAWQGIEQITSGLFGGIVAIVRGVLDNVLTGARSVLTLVLGAFERGWTAVKNVSESVWGGIKNVLESVWKGLEKGALLAALAIVEPFTHIPTKILGVHIPGTGWVSDIQKIKSSIEDKLASIDAAGKVKTVFDKAQSAVQSTGHAVAGAARAVGASIGSSLAAGISSMIGPVQAAASAIAAAAEVALRARAQVHSPSPLFHKIGFDMFSSVGNGITSATSSVSTAMTNAITLIIQGAIRAAEQQLAKAKTDLNTAMANMGQGIISAASSLGTGDPTTGAGAFGTAKTRKSARALAAEQTAQAAQQQKEQLDQLNQAIQAAQDTLTKDTSAGPQSGETQADYQKRLDADKQAIAQAIQAKTDFQNQAQIAADQKSLAEQQKRDKDNLEKQWQALQNELKAHPERAQKIKKEIDELLKKFGITPASLTASTDWATAQTLFVQSMGTLNSTMEKLRAAINNLADSKAAAGVGAYQGSHATGGILNPVKGGLIRVVEDGHPEAIIPLDPARRGRAHELMGKVGKIVGFKAGGIPGYKGGAIDPHTGTPDDPAYRASAMYDNDYGYDRNRVEVGTALAGLLGPRAQAQASMRATYVDTKQGKVQLRHGEWRAAANPGADIGYLAKQYPGITFEGGTPGQQISWMAAASRLPMGGQELGSLIASSLGPSGTGANTRGSIVEQLTSHAVHFNRGGISLGDGFAMLHKNEAVVPLPAGVGAPQVHNVHIVVEVEKQAIGKAVTSYQINEGRFGRPGIKPFGR